MTTSTTPNHGLTKYVFSTGARTVRGITKAMNDNWDIIDAELGGTSLLHVQDEKAAGTNGGDFNSGAWRTRDLNTVKTNEISGASLASNQITLPAGTYFIDARAPAYRVNQHMLRLQDVGTPTTLVWGDSVYANQGNAVHEQVHLSGRFTLGAEKTLELQHRCRTSQANNGAGVNVGSQFTVDHETYAVVLIEEVT